MWIVISGSTYYGPFKYQSHAITYARRKRLGDWDVRELVKPVKVNHEQQAKEVADERTGDPVS